MTTRTVPAAASVLEPLKKVLQIRRWKDARNNVQAVIQSLTQQAIKAAGLGVRLLGDQSFVLDSCSCKRRGRHRESGEFNES